MQYDEHCKAWVYYEWRRYIARSMVRQMARQWAAAFDARNWLMWPRL